MSNIYNQYAIYGNSCQVIANNALSKHFISKYNNTNIDEYVPSNYILRLTPAQQRIFAYLLRFRPRGVFKQYYAEISRATKCSTKTVMRATNKFHNDGVITKFQVTSCFDANQFTIENNNIFSIDKTYDKKMSYVNINITTLLLTTTTTLTTINSTNTSNLLSTNFSTKTQSTPRSRIIRHKIKETNMNNEIFNKYNIKLTTHGEIYFKYMPEVAVEFALNNFKSSSGIKGPARFICSEIRKYIQANRIAIDWSSYFREIERVGVDKNSEVLELSSKVESSVDLKRKIEILKDVAVDPDKELKEKLERVKKMISIGKAKIQALEQLITERKLTPFESSELDFEYGHLKQRNTMEIKYKTQLNENRTLRNDNSSDGICQAEKDYRVLYLKMDRESSELNKWKWILDNVETETQPSFREQTIKMAHAKIKELTKALAKDLEILNDLDAKRKLQPDPVSDNFDASTLDQFQGEIH
jgi:DNA-binding Lrp family transcriptional regulator